MLRQGNLFEDIIPNGHVHVHQKENNSDSEENLKQNKKKFGKQCIKLLELYKQGIRLTRKTAMTIYDINSLERRHKDLKESGEDVDTVWIRDETGKKLYKEYFLKQTTK